MLYSAPMRPVLPALTALLLLSSARAADLTPRIAEFLLNKVPPSRENTRSAGVQGRVWNKPAGLQAERLIFIFAYGISQDHWALIFQNPRAPLADYLGSNKLTLLGRLSKPTPITIYRIDGGRFQGYFAEDGIDSGQHLLELFTPRMAAMTPELARYLK